MLLRSVRRLASAPSSSAVRIGYVRRLSVNTAPLPVTTLTEEEELLRQSVAQFAKEKVLPLVSSMDDKKEMPRELISGLFSQGLMGIEIPSTYGGAGMSFLASCLAVEEMAKVDASVAVCLDVQNTLVNNVFEKWASDDIKQRALPRLAQDTVGSFCLSESGSGSDAFALKTRAEKRGDYYVINGSKAWITNAGEAGLFLIMANVDTSKGYKGITCFLGEAGMPGLTVGRREDKLGIRASSTCPLTFDDLKIPASNVVGEVGQGYKIAIEILNEGRIGIAAQMLGIAEGAFDSAMPYLFQRKQFNTFIGEFQGMQHQYAQASVEIEAARLMVYNAARRKMAGLSFVREAAMAKLYASQVAERVASKAIEWVGGVAFTKSLPYEKFYRDCKIGAIYEGTSNIQLQTIAKIIQNQYKS